MLTARELLFVAAGAVLGGTATATLAPKANAPAVAPVVRVQNGEFGSFQELNRSTDGGR